MADGLTLSGLMQILQGAISRLGDLPVYTFDGRVQDFKVEPSFHGLLPLGGETPNEAVLEIYADG